MTIADFLIPRLQERYAGRGLRVTGSAQPCAVFPPIHPTFGDLEIHDDGDEVTIEAVNFTHGHFSNYDEALTESAKAEAITTDVLDFLDAVFSDRVVFWGSPDGTGGWFRREYGMECSGQSVWPVGAGETGAQRNQHVWSGPLQSEPKPPPRGIRKLAAILLGHRKTS